MQGSTQQRRVSILLAEAHFLSLHSPRPNSNCKSSFHFGWTDIFAIFVMVNKIWRISCTLQFLSAPSRGKKRWNLINYFGEAQLPGFGDVPVRLCFPLQVWRLPRLAKRCV